MAGCWHAPVPTLEAFVRLGRAAYRPDQCVPQGAAARLSVKLPDAKKWYFALATARPKS